GGKCPRSYYVHAHAAPDGAHAADRCCRTHSRRIAALRTWQRLVDRLVYDRAGGRPTCSSTSPSAVTTRSSAGERAHFHAPVRRADEPCCPACRGAPCLCRVADRFAGRLLGCRRVHIFGAGEGRPRAAREGVVLQTTAAGQLDL